MVAGSTTGECAVERKQTTAHPSPGRIDRRPAAEVSRQHRRIKKADPARVVMPRVPVAFLSNRAIHAPRDTSELGGTILRRRHA
jgi:hypothetical protein